MRIDVTQPADLHRLIIVLAEAAEVTPDWMRNRLRGMSLDELTALVAKLPANIKTGLTNLPSLAALLGPGKWTSSPGAQTLAYESLADVTGYGGEPGGGKGTRLKDHVLTPFGWRMAGELKVGDAICATDGTVQKILAVAYRGRQPVYRLRWSDDAETVVDADHLWLGWFAGHTHKIGGMPTRGEDSSEIWATKDIHERTKRSGRRFATPLILAACRFNVAGELKGPGRFLRRSIPPYLLGVLLGDGSLTAHDISWTKPDHAIADRVREEWLQARGETLDLGVYDDGKRCPVFRLPVATGIREDLDDLGLLGKGSLDKFIPRIYLFGTVEERWALLRGLMDTDGWAEEDGDCYFGTSSPRLMEDVRHLARSLGAHVTWSEKDPTYTHNGQKKQGARAYTLRIKMPEPERMFALERKAERCRGRVAQSMGRFLESIEPAGEEETVCFVVSNPNRLYIVDSFVVTHNSQLLLGLAFTKHRTSFIMRRQYGDLSALIDEALRIHGSRDGFNASPPPRLRISEDKVIHFRASHLPSDVQATMGQARDFLGIDEATQFSEDMVRFLMGWVRSSVEGQRCRTVLATNPPLSAEGLWFVEMFAPWLDPGFRDKAAPGELRWVVTDAEGRDEWVNGPNDVRVVNGKLVKPTSRTFIPAKLSDNPYLVRDDKYQATLDALPEPFRSQLLGGFRTQFKDQDSQVCPTAWVRAAMARWKPAGWKAYEMTAMALDPAGGGADPAALASRHGPWFAPLVSLKGEATRDGAQMAAQVLVHRRANAALVVDMGGGYGTDVSSRLKENGISFEPFNGANKSSGASIGKLKFYNARAEAWWKFREELNPDREGGAEIALPDDPELLADLTAPTFEVRTGGILIEFEGGDPQAAGAVDEQG